VDFLLLGWCTAVHSWPELPGQMRGRQSVFPFGKGAAISVLTYRKGRREAGLDTASDMDFTSKTEAENRNKKLLRSFRVNLVLSTQVSCI